MLRGDVYRFRLPKGVGHERSGERLGVVVQANEFLPRSVVIVAPTSRSARAASFRPEINLGGERTRVLIEQLGAVDAQRLGELTGPATPEEMWGIDEGLATPRSGRPSGLPLLIGAWRVVGYVTRAAKCPRFAKRKVTTTGA